MASAAVLSLTVAGTVHAQATGGAPTGPSAAASGGTDTSTTVADVIVTAQKREQSLQDVPIVVTVAGAQLLQDTGVRDIKDLTTVVPGLAVTSSSSEVSTTARIRGVGTVGDNPGLESSVGIVVDGVYRPRNGVGFGDIGELSRVEVLKGPQGTLFGKNTSAGVINILTAQPSFKFGANAEFTAGNYGEVGGSAAVTGPIIEDKLAASLFFADRQRDGFYNVTTGQGPRTQTTDQDRDFYTLRGQLLADPTNNFSARFIADYTNRNENCCAAVQYLNAGTAALVAALAGPSGGLSNPPNPYQRQAYSNRATTQNIKDGGASLEMNYTVPGLNGAKVTSITAYRDFVDVQGQDSDFTSADLLYRPADGSNGEEFKQFSQELRLGGSFGRLDYTVGTFYAHEKLNDRVALIFGNNFSPYLANLLSSAAGRNPVTGLPNVPVAALLPITNLDAPNTGQRDLYNQDDETFALFTNNTLHVTNRLDLTGGVRYTSDVKNLNATYSNSDGGKACSTAQAVKSLGPFVSTICQTFFNANFDGIQNAQNHAEHAFTGTIKADYRFSPEFLSYVSYSRGYKSGGFNLDRSQYAYATAATPGSTPTTIAQSLQPFLNTGFNGEFSDSYELGLKSTLLEKKLLLNGAFFFQKYTGYQLSAFNGLVFTVISVPELISTGFDTDVLWRPFTGLTVQGGLTYANTRYTLADTQALSGSSATSRLPGSRNTLSPLYSLTSEATYEHPVYDNFMGRVNVNLRYSSDYNTGSDLNPLKKQGEFVVVGARVGLGPRDKRWSIELWAENLFDQHYTQVIFDAPFQTGSLDAFLGQPRTYGVTLRARY